MTSKVTNNDRPQTKYNLLRDIRASLFFLVCGGVLIMSNYNKVECSNHTFKKHTLLAGTSCGCDMGVCFHCKKSIKLVDGIWFNEEEVNPVTLSPVYTEAMSNHNILPLVGMECLFRHKCWAFEVYEQAKILAITKEYLLVQIKDQPCENHFHLTDISFKPITPPIELVDGKAYQFDCMNKTRVGYYCSDNDQLMFRGGWWRGADCTNIKLLEVKS